MKEGLSKFSLAKICDIKVFGISTQPNTLFYLTAWNFNLRAFELECLKVFYFHYLFLLLSDLSLLTGL